MKKFYPKQTKYRSLAVLAILVSSTITHAQNLVSNSSFSGGSSTGWTPNSGSSIEVNPETTYGGPSGSIYVTEIDIERSLNQQVCVMPGLSYTFSYGAARRPQSGTPANPGIQVKVTGTTTNTNYVNSTQLYTSTTWDLQAKSFTITIPSSSTDKKLNIQFVPNNNSSTYGVLISDIELAPAGTNPISISGPSTSVVSSPNNYSLTGSPAGASYSWSFSGDANNTSSASAAPTNISWASMGAKTVSVALSNGVCTMATYSQPMNISAILAIRLVNFTGEVKGNTSLLTWTTENETNARYFVMERSATGSDFDSIGMQVSINANAAYTYQFTDETPLNGKNYYRLRHLDIDGNVYYSKVILLASDAVTATGKMQVYPNPAISTVNYMITSEKSGPVIIQVFNLSGILLMTNQQQLSIGTNRQSFGVSSLKSGNYFLKVVDAGGTMQFIQAFSKI
jgi:hypothetical protein